MDNPNQLLQNTSYYSNQFTNNKYYHKNNISNLNNADIHNSLSNQINYSKSLSLKNIFIIGNRIARSIRPNNNYNRTYTNTSNNNSINIMNDINGDTRSNNSLQSNSSSNTIKSMLNKINKNGEKSEDISFQEIKCRKYDACSLNSSNISREGNYTSRYLSTNISLNNENNGKKYKFAPIQPNQFTNNRQMENIIKQKIENAKINEEILVPPNEINLGSLEITKPIKIKGQLNSCLYIHEGPILIDLEKFNGSNNKNGKKINNNNYTIKFSQLRIIYIDNKVNKEKKITSLFKLHPSTFLELEDCDIVFQNKKNQSLTSSPPNHLGGPNDKKSVAFLLSSNKKNEDNNSALNPTILTLTNSRIQNFYQSVRAGQNCIININKSAFIQNYGKAIVLINPISLKVNEAFFQYNSDNTIHVKYMDECLYEEKRKIFINKNDFDTAMGNDICIDGVKNNKLDLSIVITKNNFHNNSTDGVLIYNLIYNYFEINNNIFKKNQGNGLNIQKSFFNGIKIANNNNININKGIVYQPIKIKDNQFIENRHFGLFVNDCIIEATSNKFITNRQSGLFLCNIKIEEPEKGYNGINLGKTANEDEYSSVVKSLKKATTLLKNSYYENGENGLFILGYPHPIYILENVFTNNCRHGICMDLESVYNNTNYIPNQYNYKENTFINFSTLLNEFKSSINKKAYDLSNIRLNKCVLEKNMKSGISINFGFIYCEETFIINNLDYAILTKKKEHQYCFKDGKNNVINGGLGGDWGQIELNDETSCKFSCVGGTKFDNRKKEEIVKKVPSYLEKSEEKSIGDDYSLKKISYTFNKNINNNNISNQNDKINKSTEQVDKTNQNEQEKGCDIF